jgi:TonB family protein
LPVPVIPRGIEPSAAVQVLAPNEIAESPLAGVAAGFRYEGSAPVEPPVPPGDLMPVYPPEALAIGWQGSVVALVAVDAAGGVTNVHFERDDAWLNPAIEAMLRATRFAPATQAGVALAGYAVLRFDFRILGSPEEVATLNAAAPFPLNP